MTQMYFQDRICAKCRSIYISYANMSESCFSGAVYSDGTFCIIPDYTPIVLSENCFCSSYSSVQTKYYTYFPRFILEKCPSCKTIIWHENAIDDGSPYDPFGSDDEYYLRMRKPGEYGLQNGKHAADRIELNDCEHLLRECEIAPEREIHLRLETWRIKNNARRKFAEYYELDTNEIENLERLLTLFDCSSEDYRLCKAEVLRQLSRFGESVELLDQPYEKNSVWVAHALKELCMKRDKHLRKLRSFGTNGDSARYVRRMRAR